MMLKTIAKYLGFVLLWGLVITVVVWANSLSTKHNNETPVQSTEITITGGGNSPLIDNNSIEKWLAMHNLTPNGGTLSKTDIAAIEHAIIKHNAVESANVYTSYDGCVRIDIQQREPIARLRITGYDMYLTEDGYLLPATDCYSVRVPVITGNYAPLFSSSYMGYTEDLVRDTIAALERHIEELEASKIPHFESLREAKRQRREVTSQRIKRGLFTSDLEFELINTAMKQRKTEARAKYSATERRIMGSIAEIDASILTTKHKQKEIRRIDENFDRLIDLLLSIRDSEFWSAEVVQIVASGGGTRPLQLSIVPRSGRFVVDLGTTERLDEKLRNLRRFYDKGLDNIGWDKYRSISLRYNGQVVCR